MFYDRKQPNCGLVIITPRALSCQSSASVFGLTFRAGWPMSLTSHIGLHHGHPVGGQSSRLVRADSRSVTHSFTSVQMSHQVVVVHHFLWGKNGNYNQPHSYALLIVELRYTCRCTSIDFLVRFCQPELIVYCFKIHLVYLLVCYISKDLLLH